MENRTVGSQVVSGFLLAAKTLLAMCTGMALVGGMAVLGMPGEPRPGSFASRHPSFPWLCVAGAMLVLIVAVDRVAKILPGILAYSMLGGLTMLFSGHALNSHTPISRTEGTILILFSALAVVLLLPLQKRELRLLDRFVVLIFVLLFSFSVSASVNHHSVEEFAALLIALYALFISWIADYLVLRAGRRTHDSRDPVGRRRR